MRNEGRSDDYSSYATARWATLVRVAVLLGTPPSAASALAAQAIVRAEETLSGSDGASDPEVELFGELIAAHGRDRRPWWGWPPSSDDLDARTAVGPVQDRLDRLTPDQRARVVLESVALLLPDQVEAIVPRAGHPPQVDLVAAVARAASAVPVVAMSPGALAVRASSSRRTVSITAVVLAAALVVLAAISAAEVVLGSPETVATTPLVDDPGERAGSVLLTDDTLPIAWYAGGVLHLGVREVALAGVVALEAYSEGVIATLQDGRVIEVDVDGAQSSIAKMEPGAVAATSGNSDLVAYIGGSPRDLIVYDAVADVVVARVPVDPLAEVIAVDGLKTYVNDSDGHFVVELGDAARRTNGVSVLDAAGGVLAIASGPGEVRLVRDGLSLLTAPGEDVELSPRGRFALISQSADPAVRSASTGSGAVIVVDVYNSRPVTVPLPAGDAITDLAFAGDDVLVAVARGAPASALKDGNEVDLGRPRSDLITCDVSAESRCVRNLSLGAASSGPILAH